MSLKNYCSIFLAITCPFLNVSYSKNKKKILINYFLIGQADPVKNIMDHCMGNSVKVIRFSVIPIIQSEKKNKLASSLVENKYLFLICLLIWFLLIK